MQKLYLLEITFIESQKLWFIFIFFYLSGPWQEVGDRSWALQGSHEHCSDEVMGWWWILEITAVGRKTYSKEKYADVFSSPKAEKHLGSQKSLVRTCGSELERLRRRSGRPSKRLAANFGEGVAPPGAKAGCSQRV